MSLRTTTEIHRNHFAFPSPVHWEKFPDAWFNSNYGIYFANSLQVVVVAVLILTLVGAMAAHCLARYRFRLNRVIYFILFSTIIFPPQITIISLFQILVQYGLYNSKIGLTLVYVAIQLPLTIYILESFFARIPADLFDAARMDGYSDWEIFWRVALPIALPAVATTVILEFHPALERVPLRRRAHHRRIQSNPAARHPALHRRHAGGCRYDRNRPDDRDHPGHRRLCVLLGEAHPGHDSGRREMIGNR